MSTVNGCGDFPTIDVNFGIMHFSTYESPNFTNRRLHDINGCRFFSRGRYSFLVIWLLRIHEAHMLRREGWYNLQEEGTGPWFHDLCYLCYPSIFASCRILLLKFLLPILSKHTVAFLRPYSNTACLRQSSNATLPRHAKTVFWHSQPLQQNIGGSNFQRASKCYLTWVLSVWHAQNTWGVASRAQTLERTKRMKRAKRRAAKQNISRRLWPTHATPVIKGMSNSLQHEQNSYRGMP